IFYPNTLEGRVKNFKHLFGGLGENVGVWERLSVGEGERDDSGDEMRGFGVTIDQNKVYILYSRAFLY
ncbi:hypothetical protein, partial [Chryseobacterium sp. T20]|uniref:hypothetical protein n=1 Tax=Chryseobacterium sp. T20 TaxID=3395375 RepID=UPI0039BC8058